jgi:hypothetical protein
MSKLGIERAKKINKSKLRREAYDETTKALMLKELAGQKVNELDKRHKHDWDGMLQTYLSEEQPEISVVGFLTKVKGWEKKQATAKHTKIKTYGWRQMKDEIRSQERKILEAKTMRDGLSVIENQQVDWIKAKARLAKNTTAIINAISYGFENRNIEANEILAKSKHLSILVRMVDDTFRDTNKYLADIAKEQSAKDEDSTDVEFNLG